MTYLPGKSFLKTQLVPCVAELVIDVCLRFPSVEGSEIKWTVWFRFNKDWQLLLVILQVIPTNCLLTLLVLPNGHD